MLKPQERERVAHIVEGLYRRIEELSTLASGNNTREKLLVAERELILHEEEAIYSKGFWTAHILALVREKLGALFL